MLSGLSCLALFVMNSLRRQLDDSAVKIPGKAFLDAEVEIPKESFIPVAAPEEATPAVSPQPKEAAVVQLSLYKNHGKNLSFVLQCWMIALKATAFQNLNLSQLALVG